MASRAIERDKEKPTLSCFMAKPPLAAPQAYLSAKRAIKRRSIEPPGPTRMLLFARECSYASRSASRSFCAKSRDSKKHRDSLTARPGTCHPGIMWSSFARACRGRGSFSQSLRRFVSGSGGKGKQQEASPAQSGSRGLNGSQALGVGLFLSAAAFTGYLGTWQVRRRQWKIELIESRSSQLAMEPVELSEVSDTLGRGEKTAAELGLDFRRVRAEGSLDYSRELIVGPRSAPEGTPPKVAGMGGGYFVLTPMTLAHNGQQILVNRGWVRKSLTNRTQPEAMGAAGGIVSIVGALRDGEQTSSFMPEKADSNDTRNWLYVVPEKMADSIGMRRDAGQRVLVLDALSANGGQTWPVRKQAKDYVTYHTTPQMHLVYAGTWFGLAAGIIGLTYFRFRPEALAKTAARSIR